MIASADYFQVFIEKEKFTWPSVIFLIAGGLFATIATIVSIYETFKERYSIFTHVATTLVQKKFASTTHKIVPNLEKLAIEIDRWMPDEFRKALAQQIIVLSRSA